MQPQVRGYDVVGVLGEGGMAEVWLARDDSGASWALKVLRRSDGRLAQRMRAEGRVQRDLDHPNVVPVVAITEDHEGRPVLCMPYVAGPTLAGLLRSVPELTLSEVDALARPILAGVAAAHAKGWVHRDLKPANVLLAVEPETLVPQVADFGLAKLADDVARAGTFTQHGAGTRRYMSAEQLAGHPADPKMDVFALGALLWELIEGRAAFEHTEVWRETVQSGRAPALTREVPDRMAKAVQEALALPPDRPPDAEALLQRWSDTSELEVPAFRAATLRAARRGQAVPRPVSHAQTVATVPQRRRRGWVALGTAIGATAGLALWLASPRTIETAQAACCAPVVSDLPSVQRRFALAWEQFADARFVESERTLVSLSQTTPTLPDLYVLLALNRVARGRYQGAIDALALATEHLDPDGDERTLRLIGALERSMFRVSDGDPWPAVVRDYPDDLMVQAVGCSQMGLRAEGQQACARARRIDDLAVLSWVRGQWALWEDDRPVARDAIDDFLTRSPGHPLGLLQLGWWHADSADWEEVSASAQAALSVDAGLAEARLLLAHSRAHVGDDVGRAAQLSLALGPTTAVQDRLQLQLWNVRASAGLGQIVDAERELDVVSEEAAAHGVWFWKARAALERLELALLVQDPARVARARVHLAQAARGQEVAAPIVRRLRAAEIYGEGREAVLRGDRAGVVRARERLSALDQDAVGWVRRDPAVAELSAWEQDMAGNPEALLTLAAEAPGCAAAVRGGELLLERGQRARGVERLTHALETDACPHVGYPRYLRVVAHRKLLENERIDGNMSEVASHEQAIAALWPHAAPR